MLTFGFSSGMFVCSNPHVSVYICVNAAGYPFTYVYIKIFMYVYVYMRIHLQLLLLHLKNIYTHTPKSLSEFLF